MTTKNPIIVFFRKSESRAALPIAFSPSGEKFDPKQAKTAASLIVLDDESDAVPSLTHTNLDRDAPLGVIWHNETDVKRDALSKYGKPTRLTGFSHIPGVSIYDSIKRILANNGNVVEFVEHWKKAAGQFEVNELAAWIAYMALVPKDERDAAAYPSYEAIMARCEEVLRQSIDGFVNNDHYLEAIQALEDAASKRTDTGANG